MSSHIDFGKIGEDRAIAFLKQNGYKILAHNYKTKCGEIDVIAQHKKTVCFIEIKARHSLAYGFPGEAVDKKKQQRIIRAAEIFIAKSKKRAPEYRFDVLELLYDAHDDTWEESLITDAFALE